MTKTWKNTVESPAGMSVGDNAVQMSTAAGGSTNGVLADETGLYLSGKMSILTSPEQIRMGGLWTMNSPWMLMMPSCMAFPVPMLTINPPIMGIEKMVEAVALFSSMLI